MREEDVDPDTLDRPEWNSLVNNYDKHDIGEAYFKGVIDELGLAVENWGIDKRHHDENLIFDNKMDLRIWDPLQGQDGLPPNPSIDESVTTEWDIGVDTVERSWELRAVADVKTKASKSWFGRFNLRHLAHYVEWSDHYNVPVFVYMTMVDDENGSVGEDEFVVPITTDWNWELLADHYDNDTNTSLTYGDIKDVSRGCDIVERVFRAPDGNLVLEIEESEKQTLEKTIEDIL